MALISKETELQEELTTVYDLLQIRKEGVKKELVRSRKEFNIACDLHINNCFTYEETWLDANINHHTKFIEYEMYCHLSDILDDFRDIYGHFPEYVEMHQTLKQIMITLAEVEKYELAAITKLWVDKINIIIQEHVYH